ESGGIISLAGNTTLGVNAGINGIASITGPNSSLTTGNLTVGGAGNATLGLSLVAQLQVNANSVIGANLGSIVTANVSGGGTPWLTTGDMTVGGSGQGTLNISSGALVRNVNGFVGRNQIGNGLVTVDSDVWNNTGQLTVGNFGAGEVRVSHGGDVR